ncbi:Methyltransferase domain-containing protein [Nitrosomonas eutropha]|nr:class I SAM-dependent methyltransferase [Nitrosomonas eutropha]SDW96403.1 Methyltransferase domain-containing protein [Nitrosomonas eutropha]
MHNIVQDSVKDYYSRQLQHTGDLKTSTCCDIREMPAWLKPVFELIHPEVLSRYYGCGLVCPPLLEGCRVLDLGCGSGRDVYALAQLVGRTGEGIGIDMTDEQLAVVVKHKAFHVQSLGYDNVRFCTAILSAWMNSAWNRVVSM